MPTSSFKQLCNVLSQSWLNLLLPCVPTGLVLNIYSGPAVAALIINCLAAIPLLGLSDIALDAVTTRIGQKYGSLVYTSTRCDFRFTSFDAHLRNTLSS